MGVENPEAEELAASRAAAASGAAEDSNAHADSQYGDAMKVLSIFLGIWPMY